MSLLRRPRPDGKIGWLASQPWWSDLPAADLRVLAETGDRASVAAGTTFMAEGQKGQESAVIITGEADVLHDSQALARLGPGDIVGELSLLDGVPRTADVRAVTDLELLVFSRTSLQQALATSPAVLTQVRTAAAAHRS